MCKIERFLNTPAAFSILILLPLVPVLATASGIETSPAVVKDIVSQACKHQPKQKTNCGALYHSGRSPDGGVCERRTVGNENYHTSLELESLKRRLRETPAIGFFTKLALKNQLDDLLEAFRSYHAGDNAISLPQLCERFNLLFLKILTLLQDDDVALAQDFAASRYALWDLLSDPQQFEHL